MTQIDPLKVKRLVLFVLGFSVGWVIAYFI